jgi:hypothetical protein
MITAYYLPGYAAPIGPISQFALLAEALRAEPGVRLEEPAPLDEAEVLRVFLHHRLTSYEGIERGTGWVKRSVSRRMEIPSPCTLSAGSQSHWRRASGAHAIPPLTRALAKAVLE